MVRSRIRLVEIAVAISVVVISVCSLAVAVYQGRVMQRTLEASVVPVMQYDHGNIDRETGDWGMAFALTNTGLGPAEVRRFSVSWRGAQLTEPADILTRCCLPDDVPDDQRFAYLQQAFNTGRMPIFFDEVEGRFFAPQERVQFVTFDRPDEDYQVGFAIWTALDAVRSELEVEICYCSVFDDCWKARWPERGRERVRRCEPPD